MAAAEHKSSFAKRESQLSGRGKETSDCKSVQSWRLEFNLIQMHHSNTKKHIQEVFKHEGIQLYANERLRGIMSYRGKSTVQQSSQLKELKHW